MMGMGLGIEMGLGRGMAGWRGSNGSLEHAFGWREFWIGLVMRISMGRGGDELSCGGNLACMYGEAIMCGRELSSFTWEGSREKGVHVVLGT